MNPAGSKPGVAVSILTRAFARVQPGLVSCVDYQRRFQSSLELSPECNAVVAAYTCTSAVFQSSLELSPECNNLLRDCVVWPSPFQSSLELSPECNSCPQHKRVCLPQFQSSLELSPECNRGLRHLCKVICVSILTRAFARVQPGHQQNTCPCSSVSILTRAFARVQLLGLQATYWRTRQLFQSSLELSPECNETPAPAPPQTHSFNPHSSFRPSATVESTHVYLEK